MSYYIYPPIVTRVTLTASKTTAYVGESITFYVTTYFSEPISVYQADYFVLRIDVYVNGNNVKTLYTPLFEGYTSIRTSFTLTFQSAGTYSVYVDVYPVTSTITTSELQPRLVPE